MRFALLILLLGGSTAVALEPADILIVCNKDVKESVEVAKYYAAKRKVPEGNIIELSLPKGEDISRADYDAKLAGPLREALKNRKVKVLLTVYGVPLRVGPRILSPVEQTEADELKKLLEAARKEHADAMKDQAPADKLESLRRKVGDLNLAHQRFLGQESQAAVDSELMLLRWEKYELPRWQLNPLYWKLNAGDQTKAEKTLMTCRLDGPTPEIAKRLVDDAVDIEEKGLTGKVYLDARGIGYDPKKAREQYTGYAGYDESFREAAELLKTNGFDVTLDNKQELFLPKSCPDTALYAGWYSHANYIDSCTFVKGAVAWHLASSEATTLRRADSKVWCPNLLKNGVAATLGPVAEPYTVGFPKPAEFFGFLATGKYTLVECYAKTTILTSWMMVLVGDPLYNPFAKTPKVKESELFPSPKAK